MEQRSEFSKNRLARAVGRRKEAVAQVLLCKGTGEFTINHKPAQEYLQNHSRSIVSIKAPFEVLQDIEGQIKQDQIDTVVKVEGGGLTGQAEAIKLAVARAVYQLGQQIDAIAEQSIDISVKKSLKDKGFLTVDARVKERRKYGLKKARKASQYHKR